MYIMTPVIVDCLVRCRSAVRRFIHGSNCQKAVLVAILVNTLSMGIEHHKQVRPNVSVKSAFVTLVFNVCININFNKKLSYRKQIARKLRTQ